MLYSGIKNIISSSILKEAALFVSKPLRDQSFANLLYHNYGHTEMVEQAAWELIQNVSISSSDAEIVLLAVWFHDTGYCTKYAEHEDVSKDIARTFLLKQAWSDKKINTVLACIEATRYPQTPQNILEEIMCDADLYHLSIKNYEIAQLELRQEGLINLHKSYSDQEWIQENLNFLITHHYFTSYAQKYWEPGKIINIQAQTLKIID